MTIVNTPDFTLNEVDWFKIICSIGMNNTIEEYKYKLNQLIQNHWEWNIIKKTEKQIKELYNNSIIITDDTNNILWHTGVIEFAWDNWKIIGIMWTTVVHKKFHKNWIYWNLEMTKRLFRYREVIFWNKYETLWVITKVPKLISNLKKNWFIEWVIPKDYIKNYPDTLDDKEKVFLYKNTMNNI